MGSGAACLMPLPEFPLLGPWRRFAVMGRYVGCRRHNGPCQAGHPVTFMGSRVRRLRAKWLSGLFDAVFARKRRQPAGKPPRAQLPRDQGVTPHPIGAKIAPIAVAAQCSAHQFVNSVYRAAARASVLWAYNLSMVT
jgi:hypothetical protein